MAGDDPKSFVPLVTEKLAQLGGWVFAGSVLGLFMFFIMQLFSPSEIGTARTILAGLKAVLKFLKLGGGATILLLAAVLIAQWRFPERKEILERLWKHWTGTQKYLKQALLVMTSLFCFSYTGTFQGGSMTPLMHKIDLAEQNYRDLVWRAEIELSADLRIEAYRQAYANYSPQLQSAIQAEVSTGQRAARLPAKYLPAHFVGYDRRLPSDFQSEGDSTLTEYTSLLTEGEHSDRPLVPDDTPMRGLLTEEEGVRIIEPLQRDAVPDWLFGLPGELAEKIVDRAFDVGNISFIEKFSDEFPLIGSLIGTVDGELNAVFAEKVKVAAGRIAHRRAAGQIDNFDAERGALTSQVRDMRTNIKLQSYIVESHAIAKLVASAERHAASDLRAAIQKELTGAATQAHESREKPSESEEKKIRQENQKAIEELTRKYGYDYLLQLREFPGSAYRAGLRSHELLPEYEAPRPRPEPVTPHEFVR